MEATKNKALNVILLGVVLPIVVTVISTVVIDKIKNKKGSAQMKMIWAKKGPRIIWD